MMDDDDNNDDDDQPREGRKVKKDVEGMTTGKKITTE